MDIEPRTTERDSERIAIEHIHHMHDYKQDGGLLPLRAELISVFEMRGD